MDLFVISSPKTGGGLWGHDPNIELGGDTQDLGPTVEAGTLETQDSTLYESVGVRVVLDVGELEYLRAQDATLEGTFLVSRQFNNIEAGSFTIPVNSDTGFILETETLTSIPGTTGYLALTGGSASLVSSKFLTGSQGTYTLTGYDSIPKYVRVSDSGSYSVTGVEVLFATAVQEPRTARVKFVTAGGAAVQGPITVNYAWFDQSKPSEFQAPRKQGTATIDSNGYLTLTIEASQLAGAQIGYLVVTNNLTGDPSTTWKEFSGPVRVS